MITNADIKDFMRLLVKQVKAYPIVYKYLTYESGCQMLCNNNIQFTRGDKLNDEEDINVLKFDIESPRKSCEDMGLPLDIVDKKIQGLSATLSSFGICSLGISPLNDVLWERYSCNQEKHEDGICIGLNTDSIIKHLISQNIKTACVLVRYEENVTNTIPCITSDTPSPVRIFNIYQFFSSKNAHPWKEEQEIRLIFPKIMQEEYERFVLPKNCFASVYYGKDMTIFQREKIAQIINKNLPHLLPPNKKECLSSNNNCRLSTKNYIL